MTDASQFPETTKALMEEVRKRDEIIQSLHNVVSLRSSVAVSEVADGINYLLNNALRGDQGSQMALGHLKQALAKLSQFEADGKIIVPSLRKV